MLIKGLAPNNIWIFKWQLIIQHLMILLASSSLLAVGPAKPCPTLKGATEKPKPRQVSCLLHLQGSIIIWGRCQFTNLIAGISRTCSVSSHVLDLGRRYHQRVSAHKVLTAYGNSHSPCRALRMSIDGLVKQAYDVRTIIIPFSL